jgi:hypothetical protein
VRGWGLAFGRHEVRRLHAVRRWAAGLQPHAFCGGKQGSFCRLLRRVGECVGSDVATSGALLAAVVVTDASKMYSRYCYSGGGRKMLLAR